MKKTIMIACILFCVSKNTAKAQYLFNFLNFGFGVLQTASEGGYEGRVTYYNNSPALLHGLKGVWHIGNQFNIGYTMHFGNNVINNVTGRQRYRMYTLSTGMYFEYILKGREEKGFFSFPVNFEFGAFYIPETYVPVQSANTASFVSAEPRIQYNKPLLSWFMVTGAIGYRFISASQLYGTNNSNLAGPSLNISLVFGNFKQ